MMAVKIKPLVWDETEENWHSATTPFNYVYEVRRTDRGDTRMRHGTRPFEYFVGSIDEAKAYLQADFEARVNSVIEGVAP